MILESEKKCNIVDADALKKSKVVPAVLEKPAMSVPILYPKTKNVQQHVYI